MKTSKPLIVLLACFVFSLAKGQEPQLTEKDSIVKQSWLVTIGTNVVDDSGDEFGSLFDIEDGWNAVPYPSRISIGRYFDSGLGLEAIATYNRYKEGKIIDNVVNPEDISYLGLDFRISYDLNMILGETGFFDPYVGIGVGYTDANNQGRGTYNAIIGFRTWFSDHWGLDFSSTGKWTMNTENSTNHIQHGLGLAYRFGIEKDLSRKGEEKKALLDELAKEQQRVQDSIAASEKAEEARLLAEQLQKEEEAAARLAAEERAKKEAELARKIKIKAEIENLGPIYFALNSSYLSTNDKSILDKLVQILDNNPKLKLRIIGHTDSRGTQKYNTWLSERRAKRVIDYIQGRGISANRLEGLGYGEDKLSNHCSDNVHCSSQEHQENRRAIFKVVKSNY